MAFSSFMSTCSTIAFLPLHILTQEYHILHIPALHWGFYAHTDRLSCGLINAIMWKVCVQLALSHQYATQCTSQFLLYVYLPDATVAGRLTDHANARQEFVSVFTLCIWMSERRIFSISLTASGMRRSRSIRSTTKQRPGSPRSPGVYSDML